MSGKNQRQGEWAPGTPEELIPLAQEYFSHEFPNSGRDCPSPGEIVEQIESGKLPDDALRQHLLACSKCYVTYREHLRRSRDVQPVAGSLWRRLSELAHDRRLRILVPSLPVLLVAVFAVFYFKSKSPQEHVTVVNPPAEVVNASVNAVTTASPTPLETAPSSRIERAAHIAQVDLRSYSPQRGNETGEEPAPLRVEQGPTAFTITLPEGSPPGTYSVSILDAFGKPIKSRTSHSADGKSLTATLNLGNLGNRTYRLCVSRSDEAPNCYPIVMNRGK